MGERIDTTTLIGGLLGGSGITILGAVALSVIDVAPAANETEANLEMARVVSLDGMLTNIETTSLSPDHRIFLPPTDFRENRYIELRARAATLTNSELLAEYSNHWHTFMAAKERNSGFALPRATAHNLATPMHAVWRELSQRELSEDMDMPDFDIAWNYLLMDDTQITLGALR